MKAENARAIGESQRRLTAVRPMRVQTAYHSRIEWVLARGIDIKEGAQRAFEPLWAAQLAADFDPDALGYPFVVAIETRAGERFYAIDGQHRIKAVVIALGEDQQVQCEVVRGIDIPRAAALFRARNHRRGVRVVDDFLIGVTAKDPDCVAINAIVANLGVTVTRNGKSEGTLNCVSSLRRIYRSEPAERHGALLRKVLMLALESWGRSPESFNGDVLVGIGLVLVRDGDHLENDAIAKKLRGYTGGALGLLGKARSFRDAVGGSVAQGVASAIIVSYNAGRTKHHRLPAWGEKS